MADSMKEKNLEVPLCAAGDTIPIVVGDGINTWRGTVTIEEITRSQDGIRLVYWYTDSLGVKTFVFRENIELARKCPEYGERL